MERAATAHAQAERGDFRASDVNPGRTGFALRADIPDGQRVDDRLFDPADEFTHADAGAAQIDQWIRHDLTRPVISHLSTAINRNDGNRAGQQNMLPLAGLTERKHGLVLKHPELVGHALASRTSVNAFIARQIGS